LIYLLVYAALLLCGLVSRGNVQFRTALYHICLIGLFLFAGFRYKVGCDWTGYLNIFEEARNHEAPRSEVAFWFVNRYLHYFQLDYPYINVIAALSFFVGLHALAKRQPDPLSVLILSFPILVLELAMSAVRQAIAVGLLCFAYNAFVEVRLLRFVLFVLLAASFHSSAMFFLLFVPFIHGELSIRRTVLAGVLALPGVYYFLTSSTFEQYSRQYIGAATEAFGAPFRSGLLALTGLAFIWFLHDTWEAQSKPDFKLVKISSYLMLAMLPLSLFSSVAADRLAFYLYPLQLIVLARLPLLIPGPNATTVAIAPYAAGTLFLLVWTSLSSLFERCYIPYQIWW
jgi:hypothetical protein